MTVITTINGTDLISDSRTTINTNFSNLNTGKAELASPTFTGTPTLPTGTIAVTQAPLDNSTKVATTAYVNNATSVGTCLTMIPTPAYPLGVSGGGTTTTTTNNLTGNTTGRVYQLVIPLTITVNSISVYVDSVGTAGTYKLGLYAENGQSQIFNVTTASITNGGIKKTTTTPTTVAAGVYYLVLVPVSTSNVTFGVWVFDQGVWSSLNNPSSQPVLQGNLTVTASTLPTTFTPSSISAISNDSVSAIIRLDN